MNSCNLLASASPWASSNIELSGKKKPLMAHLTPHRKTQKKVSFSEEDDPEETVAKGVSQEGFSTQFSQQQSQNQERISKVDSMINQIQSLTVENDGSNLANFNPVPRPELQPLEVLRFPEKHDTPNNPPLKNNYLANDPRLSGSSYDQSYGSIPYYSKMSASSRHNPSDYQSPAFMEKINYMIHLLEQQQFEKTDNIMEEFFLYLLLGGFMIYVVDSFTKTGKYIR